MKSGTRQWLTAGVVLLAALVVFGGLAVRRARGSDSDQAAEPITDTAEVEDAATPEPEPASEDSTTPSSVAPAEAVVLDAVSNGDHWLGRGPMTASSIELFWAPVEAADQYNIYRVDNVSGFDSDSIPLTEDDLVYGGSDTVFVDTSVEEGLFYTYIMEVQIGEELLARRWAQTLAADDTVPPEPITGLTAERTDEGILLSWNPTDDDVEFSSYSVSLVQGDQLTYLGGGGDIEAVSFIDRNPPAGAVTYAVEAVDFHDNRTEAVEITIEPT
jgi:fibronectin type 3 domain-containing protein